MKPSLSLCAGGMEQTDGQQARAMQQLLLLSFTGGLAQMSPAKAAARQFILCRVVEGLSDRLDAEQRPVTEQEALAAAWQLAETLETAKSQDYDPGACLCWKHRMCLMLTIIASLGKLLQFLVSYSFIGSSLATRPEVGAAGEGQSADLLPPRVYIHCRCARLVLQSPLRQLTAILLLQQECGQSKAVHLAVYSTLECSLPFHGRTGGRVPGPHPCTTTITNLLTAEDEACLARCLVRQGPLGRLKATLLTCLVDMSRVSKEHSAPVRAKALRALGSVIEADTRLLAVHTVVQGASSALQVGTLALGCCLTRRPRTTGDGCSSLWFRRLDPMLHAVYLPCTCAAVILALTSVRRACSACATASSC